MSNLVKTTQTALTIMENYTPEQIDLVKNTICKGATNDELKLFLYQANKAQLDPFSKQIYSIARWDGKLAREVRTTQTSIDGFRLIAERTGKYEGQSGPWWCGDDGVWKDVWTDVTKTPVAARVGVWKTGSREVTWGVAHWREYVQTYTDKQSGNKRPQGLWATMGCNQISKCAEAQALRKGFPQELSGLYISEEMDQAGEDMDTAIPTTSTPVPSPAEVSAEKQGMIDMILKTSTAKTSGKGVTATQKSKWMTEHWKMNLDALKTKTINEVKDVWVRVQVAPELKPEAEVVKETPKPTTKKTTGPQVGLDIEG